MAACSYLMLIIGFIAWCLEMFNIVNGKVCYKIHNKSKTERHISVYNKVYFCCDNSESLNAGCRECKIGFLSVHGEPCTPCSSNSFGRKCAHYCKCEMYESCHNVFGCITVNTTQDSREKHEKTMAITNIQTTKYSTGRDGDEDELVKLLPGNATSTREIDKCEYKVNKVFLYTLCSGSLALIMVLVSAILTFYRRDKSKGKDSQKDRKGGNNKARPTIIIV